MTLKEKKICCEKPAGCLEVIMDKIGNFWIFKNEELIETDES
jgi:hypothetical protein